MTLHTTFIILLIALALARAYSHGRAGSWRERLLATPAEGRRMATLRWLLVVVWVGLLLAYAFQVTWIAWATLSLPTAWRWTGAVAGLAGIVLLAWTNHALGRNFSTSLRIRDGHTLVTRGPYRWIRHPMYTAILLAVIGLWLLSANALIGASGLLLMAVVMIARTPREEAQLLSAFGDVYREYMRTTGRFWPRWRRADAP